MNSLRLLLIVTLMLVLSACIGIKVDVSPDNQFDPGQYATYAWLSAPMTSSGRDQSYVAIDHSVRNNVNQQLLRRGYREVDKARADFIIEYRFFQSVVADQGGIISPQSEIEAAFDPNIDPNSTALHNHYIPSQLQRGHLELNFDSRASGKMVWMAVARKIMENASVDADDVERVMAKVVPKLLASVPAREK